MAKFVIYDKVMEKDGPSLTKVAEVETWKETHKFRRFRKEQRTNSKKQAIISVVYDENGRYVCEP